MRHRWLWLLGVVGLLLLLGWAWTARVAFGPWAFALTGEEQFLQQGLGLWQLATDAIRPPLALAPDVPIRHNSVNPFGINTFLQQEVEPTKRAEQVRLISEAGFHWLRQEFPVQSTKTKGFGELIPVGPFRSSLYPGRSSTPAPPAMHPGLAPPDTPTSVPGARSPRLARATAPDSSKHRISAPQTWPPARSRFPPQFRR